MVSGTRLQKVSLLRNSDFILLTNSFQTKKKIIFSLGTPCSNGARKTSICKSNKLALFGVLVSPLTNSFHNPREVPEAKVFSLGCILESQCWGHNLGSLGRDGPEKTQEFSKASQVIPLLLSGWKLLLKTMRSQWRIFNWNFQWSPSPRKEAELRGSEKWA